MGAAWEAGLTHGLQVPVCIQHHLPVKVPLGSIQQLPFLLSEGHTHIFEQHLSLQQSSGVQLGGLATKYQGRHLRHVVIAYQKTA